MDWAQGLGAGRWRANDGDSWRAAATAALGRAVAEIEEREPGATIGAGRFARPWGHLSARQLAAAYNPETYGPEEGWFVAYARWLLAFELRPVSGPRAVTSEILTLSSLLDEIQAWREGRESVSRRLTEVTAALRSLELAAMPGLSARSRWDGDAELDARASEWAATALSVAEIVVWEVAGIDPPEAAALAAAGLTPEQASEDVPDSTGMIFEDFRRGEISVDEARALAGLAVSQ